MPSVLFLPVHAKPVPLTFAHLSVSQDGTIRIWDPRRPSSAVARLDVGSPAFTLALPPQQPHLALLGDQLGRLLAFDWRVASSSADGAGAGGKALLCTKVAGDIVRCLACAPSNSGGAGGLDVAACGDDCRVQMLSSKEAAVGELATLKVGGCLLWE